jgi:peptidoglycan/LPS O-acetylase OafA/YrhL
VAVLPVVLYHAGVGCTGGYVGVDVFFVISGFLITRLLARDLEEGRFSLLEFWHRRVRRIFPAAFVMVMLTLLAGGFLMLTADYKELGQSALAQSFIGANFFFWDDTGYFATAADSKPLLHTWSLAVEEQFYLLFPLLLAALWRRGMNKVRCVLMTLLVLSLVASLFGPAYFPTTAFYLLPTRAWELLLGAVLVFIPGAKRPLRAATAATGLGMVFGAVFIYTAQTPFPGMAAVLPCLGAALIIWSGVTGPSWVHRMLCWRPLVFVGLISYSLYLWHWPVLVLVLSRKFLIAAPTSLFVTGQIAAAFVLAVLSWRFVETPFRTKGWLPQRRSMLRFGVACTLITAVSGAILSATKGLPARLPAAVRQLTADPPGLEYDPNIATTTEAIRADHVPVIGDVAAPAPTFLLWGDSHALASHPVFDVLAKEKGLRGYVIGRTGTTPLLGTWRRAVGQEALAFHAASLDFIRLKKLKTVFLVSYWALYTEGHPNRSSEWFITDDEKLPDNSEAAFAVFEHGLTRTVAALRDCGVEKICLLRQVPEQPIHVADVLTARMLTGQSVEHLGATLAAYRERQRRVDRVLDAMRAADVLVLDPAPLLMDAESRTILIHDDRATFEDEGHLSVEGSMLLKPLLAPYF